MMCGFAYTWIHVDCGRGGGGVPIPTRGHTLWYFKNMHFVIPTVPKTAFVFDGFFLYYLDYVQTVMLQYCCAGIEVQYVRRCSLSVY
jgi:hypothetical protein